MTALFSPWTRRILARCVAAQLAPGGQLLLPLEVAMRQLSVAFERVDDSSGFHLESRSVQEYCVYSAAGLYAAADVTPVELMAGVELFTTNGAGRNAAGQILEWLQQPPRDWQTGVEIVRGAFWRSLTLWLRLHEPDMAGLRATGQAISSGQIPLKHLFAVAASIISTAILCDQNGMAALLRAHPTPATRDDADDPEPFELVVRQFGAGEAAARRLVSLVQAWDVAGRPAVDEMRLAAYSKKMAPPETGGFLVGSRSAGLLWSGRGRCDCNARLSAADRTEVFGRPCIAVCAGWMVKAAATATHG
ncbi:MAG: hypothetical protein R2911_35435 [Caldilineaceae bacterium]